MSGKNKFLLIVSIVVLVLFVAFFASGFFGKEKSGINQIGGMEIAYDKAEYEKSSIQEQAPMTESPRTFAVDEESFVENAEDRLIIRTGELSLIVNDVRDAVDIISGYAVKNEGFVVGSNIKKEDLELTGWITVRIPVELFEESMEEFKKLGEVESERTRGQDITEEYIDLEARLNNLRSTEEQFLKIMDKAEEIEDVLAVQKELTWVREEIERIEGRLKYLQQSAALSTLTVYLSTDPSTLPVIDDDEKWKPLAVFKNALRSLLEFGKGIVNVLIWIGVYIPVIAVVVLIVWGIRRGLNRHKKNRKKHKK
ncbi:DUF4349 domain-containing protein [Candidatus Peregrinibacteria bacterium]|nr:DUF4349 domain-containing protein [Candidatus Peregrinibacteria bacterium]